MPTNRNRRTRKSKEHLELDDSIKTFFLTGEVLPGTPAHEHFKGFYFDDVHDKARALWLQYKTHLLKEWKGRGLSWAEREFVRYGNK